MKKTILTLLFICVSLPFYAQWWEPQISGVNVNLNDVYCITGDVVVIVGDSGTILKTIDGGTHWVQKTSGTTNDLAKVQFFNATTGYAVGNSGTLLKTIDGGESWNAIATGFTTQLSGLSVLSENVFYVSGSNGLIKRTNDGGLTFIDRSYAATYPFNTFQFLNEQVGYASSYDSPPYGISGDSKFIKTIDGGATWTLIPDEGITAFYFLTENIGFLRSNFGISKTTDGGLNLTPIGDPGFQTPDIFSLNENVVWYVTNNFTLCFCSYFCVHKINLDNEPSLQETRNCYQDTNGAPPFMAIHFANETTGYAVGWEGKILKNSTGNMENLAVDDFEPKALARIYPNPSSNQITISFPEKRNRSFSMAITDLLGKTIVSQSYQTQEDTTVNIESFSNGIYFVKIQSDKGSNVQKIVKQ